MNGFIAAGIIGISLGAQYALLALGFTLMFGILGVINFAHGAFYVVGGYFTYAAVSWLGLPFPAAVIVAVLLAGALGYVFELVVLEPVIQDYLATLMLTLGFHLILTTAILVIFGPESPHFEFPVSGAIRGEGFYIPYANLIVLAISALAIGAIYLIMHRTDFGRALRALADDRAVAAAQGIHPRRLFPLAFAVATVLAALTGALVTPMLALAPNLGESVLTTSFMIVILGGLGSIGGATIAAFVVGIVEAYSSVYLGGSQGALALFIIVLVILVVRPRGLFGSEFVGH